MKAPELQAIVAAILLSKIDQADNAAMDIAATRAEALIMKCDMEDTATDDEDDDEDGVDLEDIDDDDDEFEDDEDDDDVREMHRSRGQ